MEKKHDLKTDATCLLRERLLSRVTPNSLTYEENGTVLPATIILEREGRDTVRYLVPIGMTSDLLGFKQAIETEPCMQSREAPFQLTDISWLIKT